MSAPEEFEENRTSLTTRFVAQAPALVAWLRLCAPRHVGKQVLIEDLAQEVWTRALEIDHKFDGRSSFRTWLLGIAGHVLLEARRSDYRQRRIQIDQGQSSALLRREQTPAELTSVTGQITRGEAMQHLFDELAKRDEVDRRLFQLRGLEQRRHQECASRLGISTDASEKRWQRLRGDLRTALERVGISAT